jgi:hypothetical protein
MPDPFEPRIEILPPAQKEIWPQLAPAPGLSFVLYGGTAVALHLGHRVSIDFDFFSSEPLEKAKIETSFQFARSAHTIQEEKNTLVLSVPMPAGPVKISFFGGMGLGRINDPLRTKDLVLLVASLEDLLATKLKAILDRAEAKDIGISPRCYRRAFRWRKGWGYLPATTEGIRRYRSKPWVSSRTAICRPFPRQIRICFEPLATVCPTYPMCVC